MSEHNQKDHFYIIGGTRYRLEPLSWQQNKWLAEYIFKEIDLERLDFATIWDLFRAQGPLIMAISLIPDGETRADHSRHAFEDISLRADDFAAELTGGEVAAFAPHFFAYCRPEQLAMLMPGKALVQQMEKARQGEAVAPSGVPGETTLSGASSPSAAVMSPSSTASSPDGGLLTPSPISGAASSGRPSTAPSSAGSASSFPG